MGAVFFPPSSPVAISPHDLEEVSTDQVAVINSSITTTITTVDAVSLLQQLSLEEESRESIHESPTAPDHIYRSHVEIPAIVHNNLAAFILENAKGPKFANKIAIVDGATGTEYTYLQVGNCSFWLLAFFDIFLSYNVSILWLRVSWDQVVGIFSVKSSASKFILMSFRAGSPPKFMSNI